MPSSGATESRRSGRDARPPGAGLAGGCGATWKQRVRGLAGAVLGFAAAGVAAAGCARPSSPPGAADETRPPAVRSVTPARDTVLAELSGAAKVRFDEPIEAGSGLERELVASPAYQYTVSVGHSEISVRPEGGWRRGAVYVLELPAGIPDLLDNARKEPVRLVFSTGPPIRPTRVSVRLFDRVTGREQEDGRVLFLAAESRDGNARAEPDTAGAAEAPVADTAEAVPYTAVADSTGRYALAHLPPGSYWAFGFVDRNRNLRLDRRLEPYDSVRVELTSDTASASAALFLLEPDSTAPRIARVEARDSVTLRLQFDDHLRPGHRPREPLVRRVGDGREIPARSVRVLTVADTAPPAEAPDSAADDSASSADRDSAAPADTTAAGAPGAPEGADAADSVPDVPDAPDAPAGRREAVRGDSLPPGSTTGDSAAADTADVEKPPRPTRLVEIRLGRPLSPDSFRVRLGGVRNMWGLEAGVDTTFSYVPPPDTAAVDSLEGVRDSAALADTTVRGRDTTRAESLRGDTASADTIPLPLPP